MSENTTTVQQVIAGLSQISSANAVEDAPSVQNAEETHNTLVAVLTDLSTMTAHLEDEAPLHPMPVKDPSTPVNTAPAHTSAFVAWSKRILEKKRRADSESSGGSISMPKRRRFSDLREKLRPLGNVSEPILLPLVYNTPFLDAMSTTSPEPDKPQKIRKKKIMAIQPEYKGIGSLLDANGCPRSFPAQVQTLIEKQQRLHKTNGISQHAYDGSFEKSMVNDGKGKLDERGFSSTGVSSQN